ncbi:MAG: hypothetical protein ACPGZP_05550 [Panacagrimonas sp.]
MSHRQGRRLGTAIVLACALAATAQAADNGHHGPGHRMVWDAKGMAMGENRGDTLPADCTEISQDVSLEVHVGRKYAPEGFMFGYSDYQWQVPPCSRVSVTLVNEDEVRHMWMLHGLPSYIYAQGMFHLEAEGRRTMTGTFIVPGDDRTYLVHCDIAQHTEKGLKAQLKVGKGGEDLPSVPGITAPRYTGATD